MIKSKICNKKDFNSNWYAKCCCEMKQKPIFHRKQWEYCIITEILQERNLLKKGKVGLGFAVGEEPLPALFASYGVYILATDINPKTQTAKLWDNGQLLKNKNNLYKGIGDKKLFNKLVKIKSVDMNRIPKSILNNKFDFTWSSCAFEHLGSIKNGLDFIYNQMKCLKDGGWSVHTTELNLSSNTNTFENENLVIFRLKDIYKIIKKLENNGHWVEPLKINYGFSDIERYVDLPPYQQEPHLRLKLDQYITSSIVLIIQKNRKFNRKKRHIYRFFEYYYNLFLIKTVNFFKKIYFKYQY